MPEAQYKVSQLIRLNGNPIFAGIYKASELPDQVKNNKALSTKLDTDTPETSNYSAAIQTQNISVGTKTPIQGKESFDPKPAVNLDDGAKKKPESKTESKDSKKAEVVLLDVNEASVDDLSNLDGITISTAQKIAEERTKDLIVDFDDLQKRVPLKGSRKWSAFDDRLKF